MDERWTTSHIPPLSGRAALVTGANRGLGLVVARELARSGAQVVLACRSSDKGKAAAEDLCRSVPGAKLSVETLDLASIASIRRFADRFLSERDRLDLLVNNAGVMTPPRMETADGFELQFGTNHLGHFALTGLLLDSLKRGKDARVVTVSSIRHKGGKIAFDDLQHVKRYRRFAAYEQSKLANLLFALELDRRLRDSGTPIVSVSAHPGFSRTDLAFAGSPPLLMRPLVAGAEKLLAQSAEMGALPLLYAATAPGIAGGAYVGPDGRSERRGYPTLVQPSSTARDKMLAGRLWSVSEELTGVDYSFAR